MSTQYYDSLEVRDPELREQELLSALPTHLERAAAKAPFIREQLAGKDANSIRSRVALARVAGCAQIRIS